MKEVFRHADSALVGLYQSMLEDAGIGTFVHNSGTQQAIVGSVLTALCPLPQFFPTLSVLRDEDYSEAMTILRSLREAGPVPLADWLCPRCGESVPGHFTVCWNCGNPGGADPP